MASCCKRGDQTLAQVRKKVNGVMVFSESKLFPSEALARSWGTRLEAKLKQEGIAAVSHRRITLGELVLKHLKYQQSLRPLGRSTIQNHEYIAHEFRNLLLPDLKAKHLIDFTRRRHAEGVARATVLSNLSPVSAAVHAAPYAHDMLSAGSAPYTPFSKKVRVRKRVVNLLSGPVPPPELGILSLGIRGDAEQVSSLRAGAGTSPRPDAARRSRTRIGSQRHSPVNRRRLAVRR